MLITNEVFRRLSFLGTAAIFILSSFDLHAQQPEALESASLLKVEPAANSVSAIQAPILGAAKAGNRIVAVGDYGTILLSDDGIHFRQAQSVPLSSTLTAVSFADDKNGWAVGHWGAILNTSDGGEHWKIQRMESKEDRPLFSVYFFDQQHGVAVGLWSLVMRTEDGGKTWATTTLPAPPDGGKADRNLFRIFASPKGSIYVAAERGAVLRSDDHGNSWQYLITGYKGSFWSGVALQDGSLFLAGLRGTIYKSSDAGHSWQSMNSGVKSSITDMVQQEGKLTAVGLDGVEIESIDGGTTFSATQRGDRLALTAAVVGGNPARPVIFSKRGVIPETRTVVAKKPSVPVDDQAKIQPTKFSPETGTPKVTPHS